MLLVSQLGEFNKSPKDWFRNYRIEARLRRLRQNKAIHHHRLNYLYDKGKDKWLSL